jgi:hypothetical protein
VQYLRLLPQPLSRRQSTFIETLTGPSRAGSLALQLALKVLEKCALSVHVVSDLLLFVVA